MANMRLQAGWAVSVIAGLLLALPGCGATVTPPAPVFLTAAGSTSAGPLLTTLAQAYTRDHPHVSIEVQGGGSQLGWQQLQAGRVELGLVSAVPPEVGADYQLTPLARDAVAIIVHPDTATSGLSMVELRQIFGGELRDWAAVGAEPGAIQVISREDGSGTRTVFEARVMEARAVTPNALVLPNSQAVVNAVAQTPQSIAYVSAAVADRERVELVPVEGVLPMPQSIADGSYPLIRELTVVTPARPSRPVAQFLEFALSPAGQQLVAQWWGRVR